MNTTTQTVEMTASELAQFNAFKAEQEKKEAAIKQQADREAYKQMVDESILAVFPTLETLADQLSNAKRMCYNVFSSVLDLKKEIYSTKDDQKSHTFTHRELGLRITLGNYETDNYDDTVNVGIEKVKAYITSLAKDNESEIMVKAILKLLSRDIKGNLKASRVLQLRQMANDSGDADFLDGVKIIEEAFSPAISKTYVKVEKKNEKGEWKSIPTGMTEA